MRKKYDVFFDEENDLYQVRTKNDILVIEFSDKEKDLIFQEILDRYDKEDFCTFKMLRKVLVPKYSYEKVLDVISHLQECALLNTENFEAEENIFPAEVPMMDPIWVDKEFKDLSALHIGHIGEKEFAQIIKEKAELYDYKYFHFLEMTDELQDQEMVRLFENSDFVIVDLLLWNPYRMERINRIALDTKKPWLLVEGLVDMTNFSVGPIFHGKETGCYACYSRRLRANDEYFVYNVAYANYLQDRRQCAKPDKISVLVKEWMASVVVLDISKYIGGWYVPETWRNSLIFNTQNYMVAKQPFLKAPICTECKPELDYNPSPWFESVTLK